MNETAMLLLIALFVCFLVAGWPLIDLPRVRCVLTGAAGSGCLAIGSATFGLLVSGFLPLSPNGSRVFAAEDTPAVTVSVPAPVTEDDSVEGHSADDSQKEKSATPSADPTIHTPLEDTVKIPPGRPEWIDGEPDFTSAVHTVAVASGPFVHEGESRRELDRALVKATKEYVADQLGSNLAAQLIQYDAKAIKRKVVKADNLYHDVATYSVGPMHEYFALLEFGPEFRNELDRRWNHVKATSRLSQVGLFGGAGLLFLASIFGYFRLDNATRGYYTGRLQFMAAAAILAVVGVGAILSQWIHWL